MSDNSPNEEALEAAAQVEEPANDPNLHCLVHFGSGLDQHCCLLAAHRSEPANYGLVASTAALT